EVADEREIQPTRSTSSIAVRWLPRGDVAAGHSELLRDAALTASIPEDRSVFLWAACEAAAAREIREHWKKMERPGLRWSATGYWKRGRTEEQYRLEAAD